MWFAIFDNRILTTPKCGTRYLKQKWQTAIFHHNEVTDFSNIQVMIIREPFEHLKSALHTEFYNHFDIYAYPISLKFYLDKLILKKSIVHWSYNMYEIMYWMYVKSNKKIKIIHLSSLTNFMKEEGCNIEYTPSDYTFNDSKNWMSKDAFFNKLLEEFPTQMEILLKETDEQTIIYNKLINNTIETQSLI
jgi:hypothetical protein